MLQFEKFNAQDLKVIEVIPRGFKATLFVFLIFAIPLSLLFGVVGLFNSRFGYWQTTIGFFLINVAALIYKMGVDYFNYRRDLKKRHKIKLNIVVTAKSNKRGDWTITTNSGDLKKFTFDSKETFDKISVGDEVVIEISRYSRRLLRFIKENDNALDAHKEKYGDTCP